MRRESSSRLSIDTQIPLFAGGRVVNSHSLSPKRAGEPSMGHQIPILLADAKNTGAVNSHQKPHHAMPVTAWAYRQLSLPPRLPPRTRGGCQYSSTSLEFAGKVHDWVYYQSRHSPSNTGSYPVNHPHGGIGKTLGSSPMASCTSLRVKKTPQAGSGDGIRGSLCLIDPPLGCQEFGKIDGRLN